jgi:stage II sporulation protein M
MYKWWLLIAVVVFVAGLAIGLSMPTSDAGGLSGETGSLQELARFITSLPLWAMFVFILLKNIVAMLFSFVMSPLFLIVPLFSLLLNGFVVGLVAGMVVEEHSVGYLLAGLLPHGILELPAFFIGQAAALSFGMAVMLAVFKAEHRERLVPIFKTNLRYLLIALILLLPAALIETFVTPQLLK